MRTFAPLIPTAAALTADTQREIFFYLCLIVIAAVALAIVALLMRRMLLRHQDTGESFTLADLRRLHEQGQLSDDEYEAARKRLIAHQRALLRQTDDEKNLNGHADKDADADPPAGPSA